MNLSEQKPCCYQDIDRATGQTIYIQPGVMCSFHCERCGFNPAVQKWRIREGFFMSAKQRLSMMTGEMEDLPKGTVRLVFPRRCGNGD